MIGTTASAASVIAMAGDKILIGADARIVIHGSHCQATGTAAELREAVDYLDSLDDVMRDLYVERS